ncbi:MAG: hypothetical protein JW846_08250 [Dehalococcoidia bacterium]|nr:hypothetical protein [Dehalococcoidia bacterium]
MTDWFVVCPESQVRGGVWRKWFTEKCVAVDWSPSSYSLTVDSSERGWNTARNQLARMRPEDRIIPHLRDSLVGPVGVVERVEADDSEWKPTVRKGAYDENRSEPALGRRIVVRWLTSGMPPNGAVALIPANSTLRNYAPQHAITRIRRSQTFDELMEVLHNSMNWAEVGPNGTRPWTPVAPAVTRTLGLPEVVTSADTLDRMQSQFLLELEQTSSHEIDARITWRPQTKDARVHWSQKLGMWWYSERLETRWWNVFGLQTPSLDHASTLTIDCEINIPVAGIDRRIAGVIVSSADGGYFIGHRGNRLGGGRQGITKELFWGHYPAEPAEVLDAEPQSSDGRVTSIALVARFADPNLPDQVASFVKYVHELKHAAIGQTSGLIPSMIHTFSPEFEGRRQPVGRGDYVANVNHGRIVRHLRDELIRLLGPGRVFNTGRWDLYAQGEAGVEWLFELKTESSSSAVYGAIGQLKYYATDSRVQPEAKLVAVLPASIDSGVMQRIESLGIIVVRFDDDSSGLRFRGLGQVLQS